MPHLRMATSADAATILELIHGLARYEREPDAVKVDRATLERQMELPNPPFECVLAELDGAPVGFALFFYSYSTWRGKRGLWLEDLFVLESARRRGIGKALLKRLAAIAIERDCARFEWSVLDWNQPAIDFYESLGATVMSQWRICRVSDGALERLASS